MLALSLAILLFVGTPQTKSVALLQQSAAGTDTQSKSPDPTPSAASQTRKPQQDQDPSNQNAATENSKAMPIANPFSGPDADKKLAQMLARNDQRRQTAMRINEMAANLHSEKDARALVDAIAEELTNHKHLMWAASDIRHRVAHAEYEAVSDPANLISDHRIADVWNEYVREIDAPEEALITEQEVQRMRWGRWKMSQVTWRQEKARSIWNMPNVHALKADGTLADGGRPLEMIDVLNNFYWQFSGVLFGRENWREQPAGAGQPASIRQPAIKPVSRVMPPDPIRPAEARYIQAHGQSNYNQLVRRLFDELFPPE